MRQSYFRRIQSILLVLLVSVLMNHDIAQAQSGKVLTWMGEGRSPENRASNSVGELVYISADGTEEKVLDVPANAAGVYACGSNATSPDGRHFVFFVNIPEGGRDGGVLYQVTGAGQPVEIGAAHAYSCLGNGTFQYSPDGTRFAYINYDELPANSAYTSGTLRILETETRREIVTFPDVSAFELGNSSAILLQYYFDTENTPTRNDDLVDEIAVITWDGSTSREIATLFADVNCRFATSQVASAGDRLTALVGQRCNRSEWQLYTLHRDGTGLEVALTAPTGGQYALNTRTNTLFTTPNASRLIFTAPDGSETDRVQVFTVPTLNIVEESALESVIQRGAVMPRYNARTFNLPDNAFPKYSDDRRWWATVVMEGSRPAVNVIDLSASAITPIVGTGSGAVLSLVFSPDNTALYYVSGQYERLENTLTRLDLDSGEATIIATGAYGAGVLSSDESTFAMVMWAEGTDSRASLYQTLALVNSADGSVTATLFEGITYNANDELGSRQFAYPLAFRG